MGRPPKSELYSYEDLTGNAKSLVDEIARKCLIVRENKTPWIDKLDFAQRTGVKLGAIKTTIIRLKERGVIVNYEASRGRNSAWSFTLSKAILNEYISLQR
jgi:transcription initiation factor IIE alpha subunit